MQRILKCFSTVVANPPCLLYCISRIIKRCAAKFRKDFVMPDNAKLKVGVVGTGVLGRYHTRLYKANPKVELVGIFDVNEQAAQ